MKAHSHLSSKSKSHSKLKSK